MATTASQSMAEKDRPRRPFNFWRCFALKRAEFVTLSSDASLCHLVLLETAPDVRSYDLGKPELSTHVDGTHITTRFDATVRFADHIEWHVIRRTDGNDPTTPVLRAQKALAEAAAVVLREYSEEDFHQSRTRIWNGLHMLQHVAMTRTSFGYRELSAVARTLALGPLPLSTVIARVCSDPGIAIGAIFAQVLRGHVELDIDTARLHGAMTCSLRGARCE